MTKYKTVNPVETLSYFFYASKDKINNPLIYKGLAKYLLDKNPMLKYPYPTVTLEQALECIETIIELEPESKKYFDAFLVYHCEDQNIELVKSKEDFDNYLNWFSIKNNLTVKQLKQDIVYLLMCKSLSSLSKAKRLQVGEIIVTKQDTLLPGYNGTAPNTDNTCEYLDSNTNSLVSHTHVICGLQNAVYKAAKEGVSVIDSTAYSTHSPCVRCVPVILSVKIKRFVFITKYRLTEHLSDLINNDIVLLQISPTLIELYGKYYGT